MTVPVLIVTHCLGAHLEDFYCSRLSLKRPRSSGRINPSYIFMTRETKSASFTDKYFFCILFIYYVLLLIMYRQIKIGK